MGKGKEEHTCLPSIAYCPLLDSTGWCCLMLHSSLLLLNARLLKLLWTRYALTSSSSSSSLLGFFLFLFFWMVSLVGFFPLIWVYKGNFHEDPEGIWSIKERENHFGQICQFCTFLPDRPNSGWNWPKWTERPGSRAEIFDRGIPLRILPNPAGSGRNGTELRTC